MSTAVSKADLFQLVATLSPEERAALFSGAAPTPSGPKFSAALDRVRDGDVAKVVRACRAGIKATLSAPHDPEADVKGWDHLNKVDPVLGAAAQRNSLYRGKPLVHSLAVAATYLQSAESAAKRAARARQVPDDDDAPAPAAEPTTSSTKAKG